MRNDLTDFNFDSDLTQVEPWASFYGNHADLPRMVQGKMGGQVTKIFPVNYFTLGFEAQIILQLLLISNFQTNVVLRSLLEIPNYNIVNLI